MHPLSISLEISRQPDYRILRIKQAQFWAGILVLASIIGLHAWSLMRYPAPFVDEAWLASRAWGYIQTGKIFGTLDAGVMDRFEGYGNYFPWLPTAINSLSIRLFGEPSLVAMRMVALSAGIILLISIYSIGASIGGYALGFTAAMLTSLSYPFIYSAHVARTDIMAAALGFSAIALVINNRADHWHVDFMAGIFVGLAFETHPYSFFFGPAVLAIYLHRVSLKAFRNKRIWTYILGVILILGLFVALHILPNPQTFIHLNQIFYSATHVPPIATLDIGIILRALLEMGKMLLVVYKFTAFVAICGIFVLISHHSREETILVTLSTCLIVGFWLVIRNKFVNYMILFTPALDLLAAITVLYALRYAAMPGLTNKTYLGVIAGMCFGSLIMNTQLLFTDTYPDYLATQARINRSIRPGDTILGSQLYWFGLKDHPYYSWEQLVYYKRYAPESTFAEGMQQLHPDIFIVDAQLAQYIQDTEGDTLYLEQLAIPAKELSRFLGEGATLIDRDESKNYGEISIYRIDWNKY